jgi:hypothetical protein
VPDEMKEKKEDHMDMEDLLKGKHHKHGHHDHDDHEKYHRDDENHHDHTYENKDHYYGGHHGHYKLEMIRSLLHSLPHKKALLTGAIILGLFTLIIGLSLLWALLPLITKLVGYVEANGIQGVLNTMLSLAQLFWKGNG